MIEQNNIIQGRNDLQTWEESKPNNFFTADTNLKHVLHRHLDQNDYNVIVANLFEFGEACATIVDDAAKEEDRIGNHPRLDRYSHIGERKENIEFHKNHDLIGQIVWKSGIMAMQSKPGNTVHQMALFYLLTQNGEAGHACSLACTSGLIRAIQNVGDDFLKETYLPPLVDSNYHKMQHGAQFLTEIQGGSDVGANAVAAFDNGDGSWRITGEKWFCSNINAEQFLVMARPEGAEDGTRGLGVFLVPRQLDDGETNHFYLRRLKDKLGTRTLASAEVDFVEAIGYPIGPIDKGFKTTVELVLNTSRLMNAISCAGVMRRAYVEAASYACSRRAFGQTIASYPLVQEAVADILCVSYAATASGFALAALLDMIETEQATDDEKATYRILVNINKYMTSIQGTNAVHQAIEVFGGNGAIESFSILPRLYRDMVVLESWEGTHNVLCLQVLRDIQRYNLHEALMHYIQTQLVSVKDESLTDAVQVVQNALANLITMLQKITQSEDVVYQQAHARRMVDKFSLITQAALLLSEAQYEINNELSTIKADVAVHFINTQLIPNYDPIDDEGYLPRLERLMNAY